MTLDHDTERLTPREREILDLASRGLSNDEIAEELDLSRNAVRFHLKRVHAKLETGGDRSVLSRFRGWLSGAAFFGLAKGGVAPVVAIGAVSVGLAGVAVAFYPGSGSAHSGEVTPDATGRYPNGCPAVMNPQIGIETLADFARSYGVAIDQIHALNPDLPDVGPLPADAAVHVPYRPDSACGEAEMTPAGSTPVAGGTPAGTDPGTADAHEAQITPAGGGDTPAGGAATSPPDDAVVAAFVPAPSAPEMVADICFRITGSENVADLRSFRLVLDGEEHRSDLAWLVAADRQSAVGCVDLDPDLAFGHHEATVVYQDLATGAERELAQSFIDVMS